VWQITNNFCADHCRGRWGGSTSGQTENGVSTVNRQPGKQHTGDCRLEISPVDLQYQYFSIRRRIKEKYHCECQTWAVAKSASLLTKEGANLLRNSSKWDDSIYLRPVCDFISSNTFREDELPRRYCWVVDFYFFYKAIFEMIPFKALPQIKLFHSKHLNSERNLFKNVKHTHSLSPARLEWMRIVQETKCSNIHR